MSSLFILIDIAAAIYGTYLISCLISSLQPPLPPGPKRLPLIGNLLDLPRDSGHNWVHLAKHKALYGPISSLSVMGQDIIILNGQKPAIDLLDKRSSNYSDRPAFPFAYMCGWNRVTTLLQYGNVLAAHRKNMRRFIGTRDAISQLYPIEELETRRFLLRILMKPKELQEHIRTLAGSVILKVSHGYTVDTEQPDPLVELADKAVEQFSHAAQPGKWNVDVFPALRFLPDWMPGTGFKLLARIAKSWSDELAERPHQFVKKQMATGTAPLSFDSFLMEESPSPEEEFIIKWSAATLYAGGADTTVSAIYSFFIALLLHPEVQTKAQAEIDFVVGPERMPTFTDRLNLPYVDSIVKEVLRWNAVVPLCVPHVTREDDIYEGYSIRKGSLVVANIWGINHDSETYHDPFTFKPERFLGVDGRSPEMDPRGVSFGYGRRICPGKELADASIFIAVAMSLATLTVSKAKDEDGREITPKYEVTNAPISHPKPFPCTITPRSAKTRELILLVEEEVIDVRSDAALLSSISLDL